MAFASEHRCKDGKWKPGPARACETCNRPQDRYRPTQYIRVSTGRL